MSHVTERLAEFVFDELSASEMGEARRHLSECTNCREQVERFQRTFAMLRSSPDLEPPRNIVFESEQPVARRMWRWFPAAAAIAALLLITIALAGRVQVQWRDSQLTVAFGQSIQTAQGDSSAELATEIQRMKGHLAYLQSKQESVERDTLVLAASIQSAQSQRSPAGD